MNAVTGASAVVVLAAAVLLLAAAPGHLRHRPLLVTSVRRHGVLPPWAVRSAPMLGPVELLLGAGTLGLWCVAVEDLRFLWIGAVAGVVALYTVFCLYTARAMRSAPGSPCACFGVEPLTWAVPLRAGALALGTAPALLGTPPPSTIDRILALGTAVVVALVAWVIPAVIALSRSSEEQVRHHSE